MNLIAILKNKIKNIKRKILSYYFKNKVKKHLSLENTKCILCESQNYETILNKDRYNLNIKTVKCKKCGLVFTNPQPTETFLNKFYSSKMYRGLYRGVLKSKKGGETKSILNAKANLEFFKNQFDRNKKFSMLDIGCSDGVFLINLKKEFPNVKTYGIEPGKNFSQNCSNKIDGLFESISEVNDKQFDVITLFHVLEHVKHPKNYLKKVRGLLKDNGTLIIEIPNIEKYKGIRNYHIGHLFHFSPKTIKTLLKSLKFNVLEVINDPKALQDKRFGMKVIAKKSNS